MKFMDKNKYITPFLVGRLRGKLYNITAWDTLSLLQKIGQSEAPVHWGYGDSKPMTISEIVEYCGATILACSIKPIRYLGGPRLIGDRYTTLQTSLRGFLIDAILFTISVRGIYVLKELNLEDVMYEAVDYVNTKVSKTSFEKRRQLYNESEEISTGRS